MSGFIQRLLKNFKNQSESLSEHGTEAGLDAATSLTSSLATGGAVLGGIAGIAAGAFVLFASAGTAGGVMALLVAAKGGFIGAPIVIGGAAGAALGGVGGACTGIVASVAGGAGLAALAVIATPFSALLETIQQGTTPRTRALQEKLTPTVAKWCGIAGIAVGTLVAAASAPTLLAGIGVAAILAPLSGACGYLCGGLGGGVAIGLIGKTIDTMKGGSPALMQYQEELVKNRAQDLLDTARNIDQRLAAYYADNRKAVPATGHEASRDTQDAARSYVLDTPFLEKSYCVSAFNDYAADKRQEHQNGLDANEQAVDARLDTIAEQVVMQRIADGRLWADPEIHNSEVKNAAAAAPALTTPAPKNN